ncbi:Hypothetical predicted protein [Cloeon dipterum]|uniref:Uncharacterized protein n=1 Tax=Cloeon dipterum TaxID=197152 RepID=A0A8S1E6J3_9INSE|nr:Hypothetical predicted protein [Cloeon dipterum]
MPPSRSEELAKAWIFIVDAEAFEYHTKKHKMEELTAVAARLLHNNRFLAGYVNIAEKIGYFVDNNRVIVAEKYHFELLSEEIGISSVPHTSNLPLPLEEAVPVDPDPLDKRLTYIGGNQINNRRVYGEIRQDKVSSYNTRFTPRLDTIDIFEGPL